VPIETLVRDSAKCITAACEDNWMTSPAMAKGEDTADDFKRKPLKARRDRRMVETLARDEYKDACA
jgi:hypothetical protein